MTFTEMFRDSISTEEVDALLERIGYNRIMRPTDLKTRILFSAPLIVRLGDNARNYHPDSSRKYDSAIVRIDSPTVSYLTSRIGSTPQTVEFKGDFAYYAVSDTEIIHLGRGRTKENRLRPVESSWLWTGPRELSDHWFGLNGPSKPIPL